MSTGTNVAAPPRGLGEIAASASDWVALGAIAVIAGVVPLVVDPHWYDRYYWPKIELFYAATALGAIALLWRGRTDWLGRLRSPVGYALLAWLAALTVATLGSVDPATSLVGDDYRYEGLLTWLTYGIAAAVTAAALVTAARVRAVVGVALGGGVVMSVLALLQYWGARPVALDFERAGSLRVFGTVGNPIALGAYLVLLLPVALSLYTAEERGPSGASCGAPSSCCCTPRCWRRSHRGAWVALPIGLAAWAVVMGRRVLRTAVGPLVTLVLWCAAVTPIVLLTGPVLGQLDPAAVANSFHGRRVFLWQTSGALVRHRPLFGWGPETLAQIYPAYGTPAFFAMFPYARMIQPDRGPSLQRSLAAGDCRRSHRPGGLRLAVDAAILRTGWRTARAPAATRGPGRSPAGCSAGSPRAYFAQLQLAFSYVSVAPVLWVLVRGAARPRSRVLFRGAPRVGPGVGSSDGPGRGSETPPRAV